MSEELKPCPFCGSMPTLQPIPRKSVIHHWCVYCQQCGTEGRNYNHKTEAAEHWNRRAQPESPQRQSDRIAELERQLAYHKEHEALNCAQAVWFEEALGFKDMPIGVDAHELAKEKLRDMIAKLGEDPAPQRLVEALEEHPSKDMHEAVHRLFSLAGIAWDDGNDPTSNNAVYNLDEIRETMRKLYRDSAALRASQEPAQGERKRENVPPSYRTAEKVFAKIRKWTEDGIRYHPTDIWQVMQAERGEQPAPSDSELLDWLDTHANQIGPPFVVVTIIANAPSDHSKPLRERIRAAMLSARQDSTPKWP